MLSSSPCSMTDSYWILTVYFFCSVSNFLLTKEFFEQSECKLFLCGKLLLVCWLPSKTVDVFNNYKCLNIWCNWLHWTETLFHFYFLFKVCLLSAMSYCKAVLLFNCLQLPVTLLFNWSWFGSRWSMSDVWLYFFWLAVGRTQKNLHCTVYTLSEGKRLLA